MLVIGVVLLGNGVIFPENGLILPENGLFLPAIGVILPESGAILLANGEILPENEVIWAANGVNWRSNDAVLPANWVILSQSRASKNLCSFRVPRREHDWCRKMHRCVRTGQSSLSRISGGRPCTTDTICSKPNRRKILNVLKIPLCRLY